MIAFISLAWRFRYLIGVAIAAIVIGAAILAYGHSRYKAGEAKVQAAWDKAVIEAERQRNAERREAAEALRKKELEHQKDEEQDNARIQRLQDDLARALSAHPDLPRIPGGLLGPRRALSR